MTPLLIYSHENEPLTRVLLSSNFDQKYGLIKISIKDLLEKARIFDEIDDFRTIINWKLPLGITISNSKQYYLINRVLSVSKKLFDDFSEQDQLYALTEFRAYLAFALEAFPNSFLRPNAFGLSGNRFSLPRQWKIIQEHDLAISVPEYYLGNMEFSPLEGNVVYSDPYNFYYWKSIRDNVNFKEISFAFVKPIGQPIVVFVTGNKVEAFYHEKSTEIPSTILPTLYQTALQLSKLFNYSICEILFFESKEVISFGMISNVPHGTSKKHWFPSSILFFFEREISRKYGTN